MKLEYNTLNYQPGFLKVVIEFESDEDCLGSFSCLGVYEVTIPFEGTG